MRLFVYYKKPFVIPFFLIALLIAGKAWSNASNIATRVTGQVTSEEEGEALVIAGHRQTLVSAIR